MFHLKGEYTRVVYITYTMATRDLPDIYSQVQGPAALGLGHIYQANPWQALGLEHINQANPLWPWYK